MNLRVSVSALESFRLFQREEWMTEARFLDGLRGVREQTDEMRIGAALHDRLESDAPAGDVVVAVENGTVVIPAATIEACRAVVSRDGVAEVPVTWSTTVGVHDVTVSGRIDRLTGLGVEEYKTKWRPLDVAEQQESSQWRWYLLMSGARSATYHTFELCHGVDRGYAEKAIDEGWPAPPDLILLNHHHAATWWRYPDLEHDCRRQLAQLVEYLESRDLLDLVQDRKAAA